MSRRRMLVLATHNVHKKKEMNTLLKHMNIKIIGLDQYPQIRDIEESGSTLIENSFIKARTVHEVTGLSSLADDTGLEVDALKGAPGVFTARYAGENATFNDNVNKLLKELKSVPNEKRTARFRTVISFVDQSMELYTEGIVEGLITLEPRGNDGFGYDPIFLPSSQDLTFSEMDTTVKNKISHRGKALIKMKQLLQPYFEKGEDIGKIGTS